MLKTCVKNVCNSLCFFKENTMLIIKNVTATFKNLCPSNKYGSLYNSKYFRDITRMYSYKDVFQIIQLSINLQYFIKVIK